MLTLSPQPPTDFFTFTKVIFNKKLHFRAVGFADTATIIFFCHKASSVNFEHISHVNLVSL